MLKKTKTFGFCCLFILSSVCFGSEIFLPLDLAIQGTVELTNCLENESPGNEHQLAELERMKSSFEKQKSGELQFVENEFREKCFLLFLRGKPTAALYAFMDYGFDTFLFKPASALSLIFSELWNNMPDVAKHVPIPILSFLPNGNVICNIDYMKTECSGFMQYCSDQCKVAAGNSDIEFWKERLNKLSQKLQPTFQPAC